MKLLKNNIMLIPSASRMRGGIAVPEAYAKSATNCLVLEVGPDVNPAIKPGCQVLARAGNKIRQQNIMGDDGRFICDASNVYALFVNKKIFSLGRTVIVRRDIRTKQLESGLVIPENRRYQSLDAEVIRKGINRSGFYIPGIKPGDKVQLESWNESMIDIELEDGSYGLIVQEKHIAFVYED